MPPPNVYVSVVDTPEGTRHLVTVLPPAPAFRKGIPSKAIVGTLRRPVPPGRSIEPGNFVRNPVFHRFLHEVISKHAPQQAGFQQQARQMGSGYIYVLDGRTGDASGDVPPHDIFGALQVASGNVVGGSYQPNPNHQLLTGDGFFQLPPGLHAALLQELERLNRGEPDFTEPPLI